MATCDHCGTTIVFGGKKDQGYRFCNDACRKKAMPMLLAEEYLDLVPPGILEAEVLSVHQGPCPRCGGEGPIGVHDSTMMWSAIFFGKHLEQSLICCTRCGRRQNLIAAVMTFFLGWWSFPEGLLLTPILIGVNLIKFICPNDTTEPTEELRTLVARDVAQAVMRTLEKAEAEAGGKIADGRNTDGGKPDGRTADPGVAPDCL